MQFGQTSKFSPAYFESKHSNKQKVGTQNKKAVQRHSKLMWYKSWRRAHAVRMERIKFNRRKSHPRRKCNGENDCK